VRGVIDREAGRPSVAVLLHRVGVAILQQHVRAVVADDDELLTEPEPAAAADHHAVDRRRRPAGGRALDQAANVVGVDILKRQVRVRHPQSEGRAAIVEPQMMKLKVAAAGVQPDLLRPDAQPDHPVRGAAPDDNRLHVRPAGGDAADL
jgi:hypothetical protein